jgi:hypothetical protein
MNRKKPPVHQNQYRGGRNQKGIDLYNPNADVSTHLPHVGSTNELRGGQRVGIHGSGQNSQNMAYVNISSDGAKPVGPIGLKRAEKELIMRRYKYNHHHPNDNINRVALIYGQ